jgi:hypothetical protein
MRSWLQFSGLVKGIKALGSGRVDCGEGHSDGGMLPVAVDQAPVDLADLGHDLVA